jgi:GTPase
MSFVDFINISLAAGKGGDGVVRWRREKNIPRGGPAGGDGGNGGDVYVEGVKDNSKLEYYVGKKALSAEKGQDGGSKSLYGENGKDLVLTVPLGTVITNLENSRQYDITNSDKILLLKGGRGGLGNIHFKSAINQVPQEQSDGQEGEQSQFTFELRLIADAGLIGLPSAGKSTLLNFLTNAKSKTAEYHFTTLEPHLGTLYEFVLADIPGLIKGAATGKGLGHKFLRHISRTKVLLHCIDVGSEDVMRDYQTIRTELADYNPDLLDKLTQIILTKCDTVSPEVVSNAIKKFPQAWTVSVLDNDSVKELSDNVVKLLRSQSLSDNEQTIS